MIHVTINHIQITGKNMADFNVTALLDETRRESDDYINATAWCQKFGEEWKRFQDLESTKKYIKATCQKLKVAKNVLVETSRAKGSGRASRTYVHPLVAIELARWLSPEFSVEVNEIFRKYLDGNADLGLDIMLRDHNKGRLDRAKARLNVVETNKQVADMAIKHNVSPARIHNDRYQGLYKRNAEELRGDARDNGLRDLAEGETPLNLMSRYDLRLNELANLAAEEAGHPDTMPEIAEALRDFHKKAIGKDLVPTWVDNRMQPEKARATISSGQMELLLG